ncbi:bile acid:sodium symporter family protein [Pseudoduganella sp. OTU4001]|uniref:bile acid:sodium symporter family protein n=1 Tax=Pseudoduganella sp. OTU4001 TaxID=3043854 RepID=UPI00313B0385
MQGDIVSSLLLPAALAFIMFSLGLGLTPADFGRIVKQPRALLVGVLCHFVLLPLACFAMLKVAGIGGAFAVGFMILAACPTGTTSNLLTYIARGDVALALSFTAVASVLTIFTLPMIVSFALEVFAGSEQAVQAPVGAMMKQMVLMLGLPVAIGMTLRHLKPAFGQRIEGACTKVASILFILIVLAAVAKNWVLLRDNFHTLAPFALALNVTMLACGFGVAWLARLSRQQSVTLGIETAIQNGTLAMVIGSSVLKQDAYAIPGALYGVLMYVSGLAFAYGMRSVINRGRAGAPATAPGAGTPQ